jgi:hypothetical protein
VPILPALVQAGAHILSSVMPPPKPSDWLAGIGLKKKTAKLFQLVRLFFHFGSVFFLRSSFYTLYVIIDAFP